MYRPTQVLFYHNLTSIIYLLSMILIPETFACFTNFVYVRMGKTVMPCNNGITMTQHLMFVIHNKFLTVKSAVSCPYQF